MTSPALAEPSEAFLAAIRGHRVADALRLAADHPGMSHASIFAAAAMGDAGSVGAGVARDPGLAVTPDAHGWTALFYACASPLAADDPEAAAGIRRAAERLLDAGADANTHTLFNPADPHSRNPALYQACMTDQRELVALLLGRGADPNDGESIYHAAEHDRRECLELLLAHGADLGGRHPHWNNTPLYFLSGYTDHHPNAAAALLGTRWLLEHGADPNVTSYDSRETPLHAVARNGRGAQVLELLIAHGADLNVRRADGRTPWVLARRAGAVAAAECLKRHGAETGGMTPADQLIAACMDADEAAARAALAAHPGLIERLTAEDRHAFVQAAQGDRDASLRLMARLGFDLSREETGAGTPLHWAAWNGRTRAVRTLLELGAPVNARDREFGSSAVGWAAHGSGNCRNADADYIAVLEALLEAGADRAASFNRWNEPPEALASPRVAAHLHDRGFAS